MYLGKSDVNTYEKSAEREFLIADGQGSYAFSTVSGANTRREQGLLVSGGNVLVSKVEETLFGYGKKYHLSTNRYRDVAFPDGFRYVQEFTLSPLPSALFVLHSIFLRKTLFMPRNAAQTVVKYELLSSPERIQLEIRPLVAHRGRRCLRTEKNEESFKALVNGARNALRVDGDGLVSHLAASSGEWQMRPLWFENLQYESDASNLDVLENLWSPGHITFDMAEGDVVWLVLGCGKCAADPALLTAKEEEMREYHAKLQEESEIAAQSGVVRDLLRAASTLIITPKSEGPAILTGYPSCLESARATFVSLPGLTLAAGRHPLASALLDKWLTLSEKHDGLVPGEIRDGESCFGAVDSGLWLFYALDKYCRFDGSFDKAHLHWKALKRIVGRYLEGILSLSLTRGEDGLLRYQGSAPEAQWMDGMAGGEPVVRRSGALVEVNALWYNALRAMETFAEFSGDQEAEQYGKEAGLVRESFSRLFWNPSAGGLYDWVDEDEREEAVRPNQILAVSLPGSPLEPEIGRSVVETCWNELYTTYGLRTLDPRHDKYKGRFEGRPDQKKKAWFRGMSWPWLLGHFITAYLRFNPKRNDMARLFVHPFSAHMRHGCLGGIAEVFDGALPYEPHGDPLSAMSVGEMLRVLDEDIYRQGRGV